MSEGDGSAKISRFPILPSMPTDVILDDWNRRVEHSGELRPVSQNTVLEESQRLAEQLHTQQGPEAATFYLSMIDRVNQLTAASLTVPQNNLLADLGTISFGVRAHIDFYLEMAPGQEVFGEPDLPLQEDPSEEDWGIAATDDILADTLDSLEILEAERFKRGITGLEDISLAYDRIKELQGKIQTGLDDDEEPQFPESSKIIPLRNPNS